MTALEPTVRVTKRKTSTARKGFRMDAYLRYSAKGDRDVEGERFQSLREQREQIEVWAQAKGVEIVRWHEDGNVSGGKMQRPAFDAMMARVRAREIDGVAVAMLDRFSRAKPSEAMDVVEELYALGRVLAALDIDGCDPTTPTGELTMTVMLSINRLFRRQAGEKYSAARGRAVRERRLYIANSTPVGYRRVRPNGEPAGPNTRAARLVEDPVEGPIVRELFERRALGESWQSLRDWLQSTGVRPQAMRRKVSDGEGAMVTVEEPRAQTWGASTVKRLVSKRVYLGEIGDDHGGVIMEQAHPALVDRETFNAAQATRRPRAPKGARRSALQGLVYCAGCSYKMGLQSPSPAHPASYFYCNRHRNSKDCPAPPTIAVNSDVRTRPKRGGEYVHTVGLVDYVTEAMLARVPNLSVAAHDEGDRLAELGGELRAAVKRLDDFLDDDLLRESVGREAFARRSERLQASIDELEAERARLELTSTRQVLTIGADELRAVISSSVEDHHSALTQMINGVFVSHDGGATRGASPGRVHIVWFDKQMPPVPRHGPHGGAGFPRAVVFGAGGD